MLLPYGLLRRTIHLDNLFHPAPPLGVFEREQLLVRPVEVISDVGYLLVNLGEGVAYDSPKCSGAASKRCWHCGQTTRGAAAPLLLMRL